MAASLAEEAGSSNPYDDMQGQQNRDSRSKIEDTLDAQTKLARKAARFQSKVCALRAVDPACPRAHHTRPHLQAEALLQSPKGIIPWLKFTDASALFERAADMFVTCSRCGLRVGVSRALLRC